MELEFSPKLPDGAHIELELPVTMLERMRRAPRGVEIDERAKVARVKLEPRGRQRLGKTKFRRRSRDRLRLVVLLPPELRRPHYDIVVRQLWRDAAVGGITFRLRRPQNRGEVARRDVDDKAKKATAVPGCRAHGAADGSHGGVARLLPLLGRQPSARP
jgi:hypothetical protein